MRGGQILALLNDTKTRVLCQLGTKHERDQPIGAAGSIYD